MSTTSYDKQFVDALIAFAFEENSPDLLIKLRNNALAQMGVSSAEGGGETSIVSANLQGKSFTFRIEKPASQLFKECSEALRQYNNGTVTTSVIDWWSYGYWPMA